MDNLNQRRSDFEIVPWPASASQGESSFGDLFGRIGSGISDVAGRIADAVRSAGIIDLTAQADKSVRRGPRDLAKKKLSFCTRWRAASSARIRSKPTCV
jgi:hypothetical protein